MNEINKALPKGVEFFEALVDELVSDATSAGHPASGGRARAMVDVSRANVLDAFRELQASAPEPSAGQCGESCERAKLCGACARGLEEAQEPAASEREAFEEWAQDQWGDRPEPHNAWLGWQARAERERISPDAWKQLGRDELMLEQGERFIKRSSDLTSDERIDEAVEAAWEKAEQETVDGESPETEWARYGRHCYLAALSASNQNGGE